MADYKSAVEAWQRENPGKRVNRAVLGGQFEKEPTRRPIARGPIPTGRDLLERIQSGTDRPAPTEYLAAVREKVSENCEELLEMGARIRPLMAGDKQVGWIRGVHPSERNQLRRWIKNPDDFIFNMILLGTSFTAAEVEAMSAPEVYALIEIIRKMTDCDLSLSPFLSAFCSTQMSENLWFSKGVKITNYENRVVNMPDGKTIRIQTPPNQVRVWASLCNYREQAKKRLDENWNAVLTVRPHAGKGAEPIVADLKRIARSLETNSMEPWSLVVRSEEKPTDDGWAHGGGSSTEELMREMNAMIKGDKHEKYMDKLAEQMETEEIERQKKIAEARRARNTTGQLGVVDERKEFLTEAQMRERQAALKKGKTPPVIDRNKERERREVVLDSKVARFLKYRN